MRSTDGCTAPEPTRCATRSCRATPDFISDVPQPYSRPSATRDGRLSAIGTVSRCPANTTLRECPYEVRATTTLPTRCTDNVGYERSAASIASVIRASSPDTDSMSTRAAVSAETLLDRSRTRSVVTALRLADQPVPILDR